MEKKQREEIGLFTLRKCLGETLEVLVTQKARAKERRTREVYNPAKNQGWTVDLHRRVSVMKKTPPSRRLLDVRATITTLSQSSFVTWTESKKCGNLWERMGNSMDLSNSSVILGMHRMNAQNER